jgi:hypothetical protein
MNLDQLMQADYAQANEADIRVVPEPGMVLVLVAGIVLLAVFNISRTSQPGRLRCKESARR